ncbi:MAG: hypothetical protein SFZ03_06020 [Candidatus Melainabacteria bacterium]|nr:hypothetical protein [Candidatus Melainabacteria bacterium]
MRTFNSLMDPFGRQASLAERAPSAPAGPTGPFLQPPLGQEGRTVAAAVRFGDADLFLRRSPQSVDQMGGLFLEYLADWANHLYFSEHQASLSLRFSYRNLTQETRHQFFYNVNQLVQTLRHQHPLTEERCAPAVQQFLTQTNQLFLKDPAFENAVQQAFRRQEQGPPADSTGQDGRLLSRLFRRERTSSSNVSAKSQHLLTQLERVSQDRNMVRDLGLAVSTFVMWMITTAPTGVNPVQAVGNPPTHSPATELPTAGYGSLSASEIESVLFHSPPREAENSSGLDFSNLRRPQTGVGQWQVESRGYDEPSVIPEDAIPVEPDVSPSTQPVSPQELSPRPLPSPQVRVNDANTQTDIQAVPQADPQSQNSGLLIPQRPVDAALPPPVTLPGTQPVTEPSPPVVVEPSPLPSVSPEPSPSAVPTRPAQTEVATGSGLYIPRGRQPVVIPPAVNAPVDSSEPTTVSPPQPDAAPDSPSVPSTQPAQALPSGSFQVSLRVDPAENKWFIDSSRRSVTAEYLEQLIALPPGFPTSTPGFTLDAYLNKSLPQQALDTIATMKQLFNQAGIISRLVAAAEGNYTPGVGLTEGAIHHVDPGNNVNNAGAHSLNNQTTDPAAATVQTTEEKFRSLIPQMTEAFQRVESLGLTEEEVAILYAWILDANNQAPLIVPPLMERFDETAQQLVNNRGNISEIVKILADARVQGFINPATGQFEHTFASTYEIDPATGQRVDQSRINYNIDLNQQDLLAQARTANIRQNYDPSVSLAQSLEGDQIRRTKQILAAYSWIRRSEGAGSTTALTGSRYSSEFEWQVQQAARHLNMPNYARNYQNLLALFMYQSQLQEKNLSGDNRYARIGLDQILSPYADSFYGVQNFRSYANRGMVGWLEMATHRREATMTRNQDLADRMRTDTLEDQVVMSLLPAVDPTNSGRDYRTYLNMSPEQRRSFVLFRADDTQEPFKTLYQIYANTTPSGANVVTVKDVADAIRVYAKRSLQMDLALDPAYGSPDSVPSRPPDRTPEPEIASPTLPANSLPPPVSIPSAPPIAPPVSADPPVAEVPPSGSGLLIPRARQGVPLSDARGTDTRNPAAEATLASNREVSADATDPLDEQAVVALNTLRTTPSVVNLVSPDNAFYLSNANLPYLAADAEPGVAVATATAAEDPTQPKQWTREELQAFLEQAFAIPSGTKPIEGFKVEDYQRGRLSEAAKAQLRDFAERYPNEAGVLHIAIAAAEGNFDTSSFRLDGPQDPVVFDPKNPAHWITHIDPGNQSRNFGPNSVNTRYYSVKDPLDAAIVSEDILKQRIPTLLNAFNGVETPLTQEEVSLITANYFDVVIQWGTRARQHYLDSIPKIAQFVSEHRGDEAAIREFIVDTRARGSYNPSSGRYEYAKLWRVANDPTGEKGLENVRTDQRRRYRQVSRVLEHRLASNGSLVANSTPVPAVPLPPPVSIPLTSGQSPPQPDVAFSHQEPTLIAANLTDASSSSGLLIPRRPRGIDLPTETTLDRPTEEPTPEAVQPPLPTTEAPSATADPAQANPSLSRLPSPVQLPTTVQPEEAQPPIANDTTGLTTSGLDIPRRREPLPLPPPVTEGAPLVSPTISSQAPELTTDPAPTEQASPAPDSAQPFPGQDVASRSSGLLIPNQRDGVALPESTPSVEPSPEIPAVTPSPLPLPPPATAEAQPVEPPPVVAAAPSQAAPAATTDLDQGIRRVMQDLGAPQAEKTLLGFVWSLTNHFDPAYIYGAKTGRSGLNQVHASYLERFAFNDWSGVDINRLKQETSSQQQNSGQQVERLAGMMQHWIEKIRARNPQAASQMRLDTLEDLVVLNLFPERYEAYLHNPAKDRRRMALFSNNSQDPFEKDQFAFYRDRYNAYLPDGINVITVGQLADAIRQDVRAGFSQNVPEIPIADIFLDERLPQHLVKHLFRSVPSFNTVPLGTYRSFAGDVTLPQYTGEFTTLSNGNRVSSAYDQYRQIPHHNGNGSGRYIYHSANPDPSGAHNGETIVTSSGAFAFDFYPRSGTPRLRSPFVDGGRIVDIIHEGDSDSAGRGNYVKIEGLFYNRNNKAYETGWIEVYHLANPMSKNLIGYQIPGFGEPVPEAVMGNTGSSQGAHFHLNAGGNSHAFHIMDAMLAVYSGKPQAALLSFVQEIPLTEAEAVVRQGGF